MKSTKLLGATLFSLLAFSGYAQEAVTSSTNAEGTKEKSCVFGVKGGVNFSNLYTDDVDSNNMLTGFHVGLFSKAAITESIAIQPEILFTMKGSELEYNNQFFTGSAKFQLSYIEVPVMIVGNITKNINIHAGPYVAYLIDAKTKNDSSIDAFDFENSLDKDDFRRWEAGVAAGVGIDFGGLGVGARYNYGLTKVWQDNRAFNGTTVAFPDAKNSVISVYLAYGFK